MLAQAFFRIHGQIVNMEAVDRFVFDHLLSNIGGWVSFLLGAKSLVQANDSIVCQVAIS